MARPAAPLTGPPAARAAPGLYLAGRMLYFRAALLPVSVPVSAASEPTMPGDPAPARLRLRDETDAPAAPEAHHLDLLAGPARLTLAVADVERRKVLVLEDHDLPTGGLPALAATHDFLARRGWNEVRLAVTGRAFTLLPALLFRPGDEPAALRLHHTVRPTETVCHLPHPALEMVSIFAADTALTAWLADTPGPAGRLLHHTSALLAGLGQQREAGVPRRLYLNLNATELTLVVLGPQLEYCNVFAYTTAEDVLYFTILVMQEMALNPDDDHVTVWGELTHDSAIFDLLRTYLRHVRLGQRPFGLQYSYRFADVFEHRYFDLLSLHFLADG